MPIFEALRKTQREIPRNVGTISQQLLMRAGFLKSSAPGPCFCCRWHGASCRKRTASSPARPQPGASSMLRRLRAAGRCQRTHPERRAEARLAGCRPLMRQQYFMAPQHEEDLCLLAGTLPMTYQGVATD